MLLSELLDFQKGAISCLYRLAVHSSLWFRYSGSPWGNSFIYYQPMWSGDSPLLSSGHQIGRAPILPLDLNQLCLLAAASCPMDRSKGLGQSGKQSQVVGLVCRHLAWTKPCLHSCSDMNQFPLGSNSVWVSFLIICNPTCSHCYAQNGFF